MQNDHPDRSDSRAHSEHSSNVASPLTPPPSADTGLQPLGYVVGGIGILLAILFFGSLLGALGFALGGGLGAALDAIIGSGPHGASAGAAIGLTAGAALGVDAGTGYIVSWLFRDE